jgi:hypothetical protein
MPQAVGVAQAGERLDRVEAQRGAGGRAQRFAGERGAVVGEADEALAEGGVSEENNRPLWTSRR